MRPLVGRIPPDAIEDAVIHFLMIGDAPTRHLMGYVRARFALSTPKAWGAVTYALLRLRSLGVVEMTGRAKGARYSLKRKAA